MDSFYKRWLEKNKEENRETRNILRTSDAGPSRIDTNDQNDLITDSLAVNQNLQSDQNNRQEENIFQNDLRNKIIYENNQLQLYLEKGNHIHQTRFRLQDHLFYLKIKLKDSRADPPLLKDILEFLQEAFNFILREVKRHYKPEDHNVAYLTLYQHPMISGLNTGKKQKLQLGSSFFSNVTPLKLCSVISGGFDLQETSQEMVERLLKMLDQFLISNQTLKLDETFRVYLKVLSIEHINFRKSIRGRIHKKRTRAFYRKHYGARTKPSKKYNFFWALDVPDSYPNEPTKNIFKNKCLISATILGLLQNEYYKSNRTDTRFLHLQNINSICNKKKIMREIYCVLKLIIFLQKQSYL
jgi:hypothetical protein